MTLKFWYQTKFETRRTAKTKLKLISPVSNRKIVMYLDRQLLLNSKHLQIKLWFKTESIYFSFRF